MKFVSVSRIKRIRAFTLVELLLAIAVLTILMVFVAQILEQAQKAWLQARSKVSQFREARRAFDRVTNTISQATLNSYQAYRYTSNTNPLVPQRDGARPGKYLPPVSYVRYSELEFVTGPTATLLGGGAQLRPGHAVFFQAPLGVSTNAEAPFRRLPTALNGIGYFVEFGSDDSLRPPFLTARGLPARNRYRLFEYRPPTQSNLIYDEATRDQVADWFALANDANSPWRRPLAENIVSLIISPKRSTPAAGAGSGFNARDVAKAYAYDSKPPAGNVARLPQQSQDYELPPLVDITMFVIDEASAEKLELESAGSPPLAIPGGLFASASATQYESDIKAVEQFLVDKKVNYRTFTSTVAIRSSKWGL